MELKDLTIGQVLCDRLKTMAEEKAVEYEDVFYTWRELDDFSNKFAIELLDYGIEHNSHVAIWSKNNINWIITYLALAKIGAISILINPSYKEDELVKILEYSEAEYVCYGECHTERNSKNIISSLKEKSIGRVKEYVFIEKGRFDEWGKSNETNKLTSTHIERLKQIKHKVSPHHNASMVFTSGTTSMPKGVMLTHYQLMNVAREAAQQMRWTKEDRMCIALPLFHCFGLSVGFFASLSKGFCIHLLPEVRTSYVLKCIDKYKITVLNGVPTMFLALLGNPERKSYDLSSLKSGIIAGSTVFREDYLKIQKELGFEKLQQSYGQTEASPSITFNNYDDSIDVKCASVGKVIPNVELKIISKEYENELQPYEVGEVVIKGYNVMQGYYKLPKENSKKISEDGWLHTDDIGYIDDEGNLYITGRKQEIIIRSGENISPREIEDVIMKYPSILQTKVFGVPAPIVQEEIAACVISSDEKFQPEALEEHLKKYLANYKVPKFIFTYKKFPLNSNGKINMQQLKEEIRLRINKEESL
ncbi:class I adenylate-forming enzyme family protein [Clostridium thailandense]|uniref:class I adenylate-forming enzyme family protein n=1 Tax=Clostridium thailandense TaxID=2794346 RepID=UPI003989D562